MVKSSGNNSPLKGCSLSQGFTYCAGIWEKHFQSHCSTHHSVSHETISFILNTTIQIIEFVIILICIIT